MATQVIYPQPIAVIIAEYCATMVLREWIQPECVYKNSYIWANPNAVLAGVLDLSQIRANASIAVANPALAELLLKDIEFFSRYRMIWTNHAVFEHLLSLGKNPGRLSYLCTNQHPRAVKMIIDSKIVNDDFLKNPSAIQHLRAHPEDMIGKHTMLLNESLFANPAAIDEIKSIATRGSDRESIDPHSYPYNLYYGYLSSNPHPWAIEQLRLRWDLINLANFAANPGIFHYATNKKLVKLLSRMRCEKCRGYSVK